jgi:histidinol-phosphate aminotransferase
MKPNTSVLRMDPYQPPSSGREGFLRLDFNENTVGCSLRVLRAILRRATRSRLATYPEYESSRAHLARGFRVDPDELLLTNGTDDALLLLVNTFIEPGHRVVIAEPCFAMYRFYSSLIGAEVVEVPRSADLRFPLAAVRREIERGARAVFIDSPNNPTGTVVEPRDIEALARDFPDCLVVADEAYYDFCGRTMLPKVRKYRNLLVTRTFSKAHGLAGLRIGVLFAHRDTAAHLRKAHSPYSVNDLALAGASAALRDSRTVARYAAEVRRARAVFQAELRRMKLDFVPSQANFVLVRFGERAAAVQRGLRGQGILVRDRSYEIPGAIRITVGTMAQTRRVIAALKRALAA